MAHIKDLRQRKAGYTGDRPYLARYRDPFGKERTKTFRTQRDARNWLNEQEVAKSRNDWIDPTSGRVTFREFAEQWQGVQVWRPSTSYQVESYFRTWVYPRLGDKPLGAIRPTHVQAMVKELSEHLAPNTVKAIYRHTAAAFKAATRDRLITRTPCEGITLPKATKDTRIVPLEVDQIRAVADAMPDRWQTTIMLAAGTGLRQGEVLGLTLDRVDFLRRTVKVDRQMLTPSSGQPHHGPPKTQASYRTVPLPDVIAFELSEHLRNFPPAADGLIFTRADGRPIPRAAIGGAWRTAAKNAKLPEGVTFHDLRHFYASLLIRHGESVKVVQTRLGHASAAVTLDVYGHLWPDSEDRTRAAVEEAFGERPESFDSALG